MTLDNIKTLLDIDLQDTSKDAKLSLYITKATRSVLTYCNITELPTELESVVEDIVIIKYNRSGSEGLKSESVGPLTSNFDDIISGTIKVELDNYKKIKVI